MIKKIIKFLRYIYPLISIHSLPQSLFFNFYYLPFKQAVFLPIWLYKPHFTKLGGKVKIEVDPNIKIYPGMIRMGFLSGRMYPNSGITWTNRGIVKFEGKCKIGNASFIVTGPQGEIIFSDDFMNTAAFKIVSFVGISLGRHVRVGYEVIMMDTNFHPLYDRVNNKFKKAYAPIHIGDNNWFGLQCYVMPGVLTPHHCIVGARSILTRNGEYESYCISCGNPVRVIAKNVERIIGQDIIEQYIK